MSKRVNECVKSKVLIFYVINIKANTMAQPESSPGRASEFESLLYIK